MDKAWAVYPISEEQLLAGDTTGRIIHWKRSDPVSMVAACEGAMPFSGDIYKFIYGKADDHIWAVGTGGGYRISQDFCITDYYGIEGVVDNGHRLPASDFRDVYEDDEGVFWLATNGDGL